MSCVDVIVQVDLIDTLVFFQVQSIQKHQLCECDRIEGLNQVPFQIDFSHVSKIREHDVRNGFDSVVSQGKAAKITQTAESVVLHVFNYVITQVQLF